MGKDKALLQVNGEPLIDRTVRLMSKIFPHLLLVTNTPRSYLHLGVRMAGDLMPGYGALGGLHTGLFFATTSHAFVVACDMPFLNPELIRYMIREPLRFDVVVPRWGNRWEPLHAVYSRRCLKPIEELLKRGAMRIVDLYSRVPVKEIPEKEIRALDPDLRSFFNVNTPEEWERMGRDPGRRPPGSVG
jgi:molybdopterin-guanine dinucleotide biosynthesis protein A